MPGQLTANEEEYKTWGPEGSPLTVHYAVSVMEELRQAGEQGFQKIPHGGVEVGAVLLGTREAGAVWIQEWRPIECSHARGPGFALSESDLVGLEQQLAALAAELPTLEVVGWFHTHTRSELALSGEDVAVYERCFPQPWQVALVMRLKKESAAVAGFFCREADGTIRAEKSYEEFTVRPDPFSMTRPRRLTSLAARGAKSVASRPAEPRRPLRRENVSPAVAVVPPATPAAPGVTAAGAPRVLPNFEPRPVKVRTPATPAAVHPKLPALDEPVPEPERIPTFLPEEPRYGLRRKLFWGVLVALLLAGVNWGVRWYWGSQPPAAVGLRLEEEGEQLLIRWDRGAAVVRSADSARLTIRDGKEIRSLVLDQQAVRSGTVTYAYQNNDVEVRLAVIRRNETVAEESTRFLGRQGGGKAASAAPAQAAEQEQARQEAERLREALRQEGERTQRLENSLRELNRGGRAR
jgi:proteasome lid subunit RPN8/RPN11